MIFKVSHLLLSSYQGNLHVSLRDLAKVKRDFSLCIILLHTLKIWGPHLSQMLANCILQVGLLVYSAMHVKCMKLSSGYHQWDVPALTVVDWAKVNILLISYYF